MLSAGWTIIEWDGVGWLLDRRVSWLEALEGGGNRTRRAGGLVVFLIIAGVEGPVPAMSEALVLRHGCRVGHTMWDEFCREGAGYVTLSLSAYTFSRPITSRGCQHGYRLSSS